MNRLKQFVTRLRRPDTREVAVAQVSDKYSEYPSNGLTPVKLAEIFREADAGDVLRQMELFEEMEEKDPHLFSQLQTRKNAVERAANMEGKIVAVHGEELSGKHVLVVDDVISTGGSLKALDELAEQTQCTIVGQAAVLAEGDAAQRKDIIFLEPLPLFLH